MALPADAITSPWPEMDMDDDETLTVHVDPKTGATATEQDDGGVLIDFNAKASSKARSSTVRHDDNLASKIEYIRRCEIAEDLLAGIETDDISRQGWLGQREKGEVLLGLKLESSRTDIGGSMAPVEGMSSVRHPLLLEAVLRFQANARGEMLPADGPVKCANDGKGDASNDKLAEDLERDMNYYLTTVAKEYYPDTDRMLFSIGFSGAGFKKVYNCPLRRRPVSESVNPNDMIISNSATDMANARRVTHKITMKPSTLRRMQLAEAYIDTLDVQPSPDPNTLENREANIQGVAISNRPEDADYTIYECYCELDLDQFAPRKFKGKSIALPYRVSINKDSREILEIRRNWKEDDPQCLPKPYFVEFPFIPSSLGFWGIGLLHILGNATAALTAAWRLALDNAMFANFPGFLYSKEGVGRQMTNEFRIPPGGGVGIQTGSLPINQSVMPLPYKEAGPGLAAITANMAEAGGRVGGTAEMQVSEGRQDAPVGTTLAMIEQATKVLDAVHKRLHAAQAEEFQLLKERFREDPESLMRHAPDGHTTWDEARFEAALNNCRIVPRADPNTPSHMHRLMKASALMQLDGANPGVFLKKEILTRAMNMMRIDDPEALFAPPAPQGPPPVDPVKMADIQTKQQSNQIKMAKLATDVQAAMADRKSKEHLAILNMAKEAMIHPGTDQLATNVLTNPAVQSYQS